jgi:hypothetical protein
MKYRSGLRIAGPVSALETESIKNLKVSKRY